MSHTNEIAQHPPIYPYLITRVAPAMYHVIVLPDVDEGELRTIARIQEMANGLRTCLVLGERSAVYIEQGKENASESIPMGGVLFTGKLQPCFYMDECVQNDPVFAVRMEMLATFLEKQVCGYMVGDLTKGGRPATPEELARLSGSNEVLQDVPKGLVVCPKCHCLRGVCLDPGLYFRGCIMTVHCRCENANRCARCHGLLHEKKLEANFYDPRDHQIWHVPGFSGFGHICG